MRRIVMKSRVTLKRLPELVFAGFAERRVDRLLRRCLLRDRQVVHRERKDRVGQLARGLGHRTRSVDAQGLRGEAARALEREALRLGERERAPCGEAGSGCKGQAHR